MLYTVWTDYTAADLNVDFEANALVNVYRLAEGLPDPQQGQLQGLARSYADVAINDDWPQMSVNRMPEQTHYYRQRNVEDVNVGEVGIADSSNCGRSRSFGTQRPHRTPAYTIAAKRVPSAKCVVVGVDRGRRGDDRVVFNVRFGEQHPARTSSLRLLAIGFPGSGRDCRYRPAFSGVGPRRRIRIQASAGEFECAPKQARSISL